MNELIQGQSIEFAPSENELASVGFFAPPWMTFTTSPEAPIIYLGGPIRSVGSMEAESWREFVAQHVGEYGWTCFNPATAFHRPDNITRNVAAGMERINREAIAMSTIVVALLDHRSMNLGTIRELEAGSIQGKRCIVVCGHDDLTYKVSAHDLEIYPSIPFMLAAITGENPHDVEQQWNWWREQDMRDMKEAEAERYARDRQRDEDASGAGVPRRYDDQDPRQRNAEGDAGSVGLSADPGVIVGFGDGQRRLAYPAEPPIFRSGPVRSRRGKGTR